MSHLPLWKQGRVDPEIYYVLLQCSAPRQCFFTVQLSTQWKNCFRMQTCNGQSEQGRIFLSPKKSRNIDGFLNGTVLRRKKNSQSTLFLLSGTPDRRKTS